LVPQAVSKKATTKSSETEVGPNQKQKKEKLPQFESGGNRGSFLQSGSVKKRRGAEPHNACNLKQTKQ